MRYQRAISVVDGVSHAVTQDHRRPLSRREATPDARRRDDAGDDDARRFGASATNLTTGCCAARPSSTTTASARSASGASSSEAAAADLIRDLLPVVDDLERALAAPRRPADADGPLRRGVELIHQQLLEVLRKRGVEPFESVGRDFDPAWHEAVAHEPANGHRDGEIAAEFRRGYRLGSRLLRPAQVKVAKA